MYVDMQSCMWVSSIDPGIPYTSHHLCPSQMAARLPYANFLRKDNEFDGVRLLGFHFPKPLLGWKEK